MERKLDFLLITSIEIQLQIIRMTRMCELKGQMLLLYMGEGTSKHGIIHVQDKINPNGNNHYLNITPVCIANLHLH